MMLSLEDHSNAGKLVREILIGDFLLKDIEADAQSERLSLSYELIASALEKALENPDTKDCDAGLGIAATMLRKGEHLPNWLALFAADVLEGKCKRPTNRGPDRYANWIGITNWQGPWSRFLISLTYQNIPIPIPLTKSLQRKLWLKAGIFPST